MFSLFFTLFRGDLLSSGSSYRLIIRGEDGQSLQRHRSTSTPNVHMVSTLEPGAAGLLEVRDQTEGSLSPHTSPCVASFFVLKEQFTHTLISLKISLFCWTSNGQNGIKIVCMGKSSVDVLTHFFLCVLRKLSHATFKLQQSEWAHFGWTAPVLVLANIRISLARYEMLP